MATENDLVKKMHIRHEKSGISVTDETLEEIEDDISMRMDFAIADSWIADGFSLIDE